MLTEALVAVGLFVASVCLAILAGAVIIVIRVFSRENRKEEDDLIKFVQQTREKLEDLSKRLREKGLI